MTGARREPGRTVTSKVVGILQSFGPADPELSLHEISVRAGLPASTALRLIRELVDAGVLEHTPTGGYCVGLALWRTGELATRARRLRRSARAAMVDLRNTLHSAVMVAIYNGDEVVVVDKIGPPNNPEPWPTVASALPLHATASGKLLLASLPIAARQRVLERKLSRFTPWTVVAPGLLASGLASVQSQGIATNTDEVRAGWSSLAASVRSPDGTLTASVVAAVPSPRFDRDRFAGPVRRAARSTEIGLAM